MEGKNEEVVEYEVLTVYSCPLTMSPWHLTPGSKYCCVKISEIFLLYQGCRMLTLWNMFNAYSYKEECKSFRSMYSINVSMEDEEHKHAPKEISKMH